MIHTFLRKTIFLPLVLLLSNPLNGCSTECFVDVTVVHQTSDKKLPEWFNGFRIEDLTKLTYAAITGNIYLVEMYLDRGAAPEELDCNGYNVFHYMCSENNKMREQAPCSYEIILMMLLDRVHND